jgi:hypothetical protein
MCPKSTAGTRELAEQWKYTIQRRVGNIQVSHIPKSFSSYANERLRNMLANLLGLFLQHQRWQRIEQHQLDHQGRREAGYMREKWNVSFPSGNVAIVSNTW